MPISKEHKDILETYYRVSNSTYSNWGPEKESPDVFAIHLGYIPESETVFDNRVAVSRTTQIVVDTLDVQDGNKILDAGCGVGSISFRIAKQYPNAIVFPVNIVSNQLETINNHIRTNEIQNVYPTRQDFQLTGFANDTFDKTVFCESLAHAQNKHELLKEAFRTSKQGGKLVIADCFGYTDEYNEKEREYFRHFQEGMAVPSIIKYETFESWMREIGFKNIKGIDLTKNMIQSAVFASEHAQMRIDREPETSSEITLGRLAMIGIEKLMSTKKVGYYLITAEK
ncbi:MAG: methyltransferase domain-containing protein [Patescibacteria group bacterium]|mgnify:CR=1 FL=1